MILFVLALLPTLLGAGLLGRLGLGLRGTRGLELTAGLARAWVLGFLGFGFVLWGWAWCELPWRAATLLGTALVLVLLVSPWLLRGAATRPACATRGARWEWRFLTLALVLALAAHLDRAQLALLQPITHGDEALIWTAAGKALFASDGYSDAFGRALAVSVAHPDYPALNPLWQSFVFALEGAAEPFRGRLPIQAAAVVLVLLLATSLARRTRPALAALVVLAVAGLRGAPQLDLVQTAYSDGLVALGLLLAVDAWLRYFDERRDAWLVVAAAGLALAVFAKNEGQLLALAFLASALLGSASTWLRQRPSGRRVALVLACVALVALPLVLTATVNAHYQLEGDLFGSANAAGAPIWVTLPAQLSERGSLVVGYLARHVVFAPRTGGAWFLVLALLALGRPRVLCAPRLAIPTLTLAAAVLGFTLIFIGSAHHLGRGPGAELWHLDTAAARVFGQLVPAAALIAATALGARAQQDSGSAST